MDKIYYCLECGSEDVYSLEFRTDYARPRTLNPMNNSSPEIDADDLPHRLGGHYCNGCGELVSVNYCVN